MMSISLLVINIHEVQGIEPEYNKIEMSPFYQSILGQHPNHNNVIY